MIRADGNHKFVRLTFQFDAYMMPRKTGSYSYEEMEALLSNAGFLIYEHMDADEATDAFLKESGMTAPAGVGYCLAVRK